MSDLQTIVLGGGCFWCTEAVYKEVRGVTDVESGYSNGETKQPTYEQVCTGRTGHNEVVQVVYDPKVVSYEKLLEVFWRNIDPTQRDGQFCDHGSQYRTGIFYHNEEQKKLAEASKAALQKNKPFKGDIVTEIEALKILADVEAYHASAGGVGGSS